MPLGPRTVTVDAWGRFHAVVDVPHMAAVSLRIHCVVVGLIFAIFPSLGYYLPALEDNFVWDYPDHTARNHDYEAMIIAFLAVQALFLWAVAAGPLERGKTFLQFFIVSTGTQSFLRLGLATGTKEAHFVVHGDAWQLFISFAFTLVFYVNYYWPRLL